MQEADVSIPPFTADKEIACGWGSDVVCRHILNGHGGAGISIVVAGGVLPEAPLYVKYIPKKHEYRVHVAFGKAILVQRKARRLDHDNPDWKVRNHANGFVFALEDNPDERLTTLGVNAVEAVGHLYGAVDAIYNEKSDTYYALEVNSSPGLQGRTVEAYVAAFKEALQI
jgi:glutathione synthase/RimK-type ligase-like ATP-grasp enzyme